MKLWTAWVRLWSHRELPTMLALIRIGVGLALLWDFALVGLYDLPPLLWSPSEYGGLPASVLQRKMPPEVFSYFTPGPELAWGMYWVIVVCALLFTLGIATPIAGVVLLLTYAQTALILPLGDRAIDTLLRNVILVLVLSPSHKTLSVSARVRTGSWLGDGSLQPAWPRHLLILQMVVLYFMAGMQKTALTWTPFGGYNALYIVLHDPHIARMDWAGMGLLDTLSPFLKVGTGVTHAWEWLAPSFVLLYWYRHTADRPGELRRFANRWDLRSWMVGVGVLLHLGIAVTMQIGVFPWAVLALYPAWFHPDEVRGVLGKLRRWRG